MTNNVILTVGNSMMGDDGAGPYLYQLLNENPLPNWTALDGGSAPENVAHIVRELNPKLLLIFDAADMELAPGKIRIIEKDAIAEMFFMSTHNMPLNFLIEQLEQDIEKIVFVGLQPDLVSFGFPMTDTVKDSAQFMYDFLKDGRDLAEIPVL
ncbi:hydrogenase maturation peptidase HycI [Aggregatibacter aphrophilus]|nr:hydrogenase maturation peptidase HycI [Aggregatibacter aphrophilus]KNE85417.1 hydrogenase 3 maturation protease [Aggregatibacter aphrophilus ATCC 33389]RDE88957.1 hydrogenase maturation peptidase HycI [Aggregatibacter aphrophilus]